jgi:hypothetical protein
MAMQPVYLVAIKNLAKFLEALRHAQAPEKVGLRFVEELGFKVIVSTRHTPAHRLPQKSW